MKSLQTVFCILLVLGGTLTAPAQQAGSLTVALTGDSIITQRMSVYDEPDYLALVEVLRGADVAFTNFEMLLHNYEGAPAPVSGGTYMAAPPPLARELVWMGFDLVSTANNHSFDYGAEGLLSTLRGLADAGLVAAGTGENLARARAPGYLETRRGRVALVAAASTFTPMAPAGEQRKDLRGRPGLSPLRYHTTYYVDAEGLATLQRLKQALGMRRRRQSPGEVERLNFLRREFVRGEPPRIETRPDPDDLGGIVQAVGEAQRQADWVIVSLHAHESAGKRETPAGFIVQFAHAVVDAGADIVAIHGPHVLRPVEIYRGRPIFYSLANFIFQNETVAFLPDEIYRRYGVDPSRTPADVYDARTQAGQRGFPANPIFWESVVALVSFADGRLQDVRLYPILLGHGKPRSQRGRPILARAEEGARILEHLASLSKSFGTQIEVREVLDRAVGYVKLPKE
ncbi:MAG: CapA family protein [Terriglobia bacterium]